MITTRRLLTILLLLVIASACRLAANSESTAAPTDVAPTAQAIPTEETLAPGNYELSLVNEDGARDVVLHLPPAYDGSSQLPLVIVLHGGAGSGEQIQRLSEMDEDADEFGFVAAYPDGSGRLEERLFT